MNLCQCGCGEEVTKEYNKFISGHNSKGKLNPRYGIKLTDEHKKKFNFKGKHHSEETKREYSECRKGHFAWNKGVARTEEFKQSQSQKMKEKYSIPEYKKRIFDAQNHKKHSEESKKKISESHKLKIRNGYRNPEWGHLLTKETKLKISQSKIGKKRPLFSVEWRRKLSESRRKEKHPNWKGGKSKYGGELIELWETPFYKECIKDRDKNKCSNPGCLLITNKLVVHHLDYDKNNHVPWNLITLCVSCHSKTNFKRLYWKMYYKQIVSQRNLMPKIHKRKSISAMII